MSLGETENWRRAAHLGNAMLFAVVYMAAACDRRPGGKSQRSFKNWNRVGQGMPRQE